jgi:hypothetical protein
MFHHLHEPFDPFDPFGHVDVAHLHMDRIPLVLCQQGIEVHNVHLNARVEALAHGPC